MPRTETDYKLIRFTQGDVTLSIEETDTGKPTQSLRLSINGYGEQWYEFKHTLLDLIEEVQAFADGKSGHA